MRLLSFFSTKRIPTMFLSSMILCLYACNHQAHKKNILQGSWNLKEVHWVSADTTFYLKKPNPGLLLITPKSYSIMWSPNEKKRIPFKILSNPTDEEIKSSFRSIVFNSGSYLHNDSTLTTIATLAKVPGFEGGKQFYSYKLENDQLSLLMFDEIYPNGDKPSWSGVWKTKFLFEKIEKEHE